MLLLLQFIIIIFTYYISISKTNDDSNAPEQQPIDMRMKKDNKAKV